MTNQVGTAVIGTDGGATEAAPQSRFDRTFFLLLALWMIVAGVVGFWIGSNRTAMPGDDSADAGFARDMITHHANAVEMAMLIVDRTEDEDLRFISRDIMLTQQAQIGQMQGWLQAWGLSVVSGEPAMLWMGMPTTDLMPGMASEEQLSQLSNSRGTDADILFLNLMIPHHESGIHMARAVLQRTTQPQVAALAQGIITSQEGEIAIMREMLQERGVDTSAFTPSTVEGL